MDGFGLNDAYNSIIGRRIASDFVSIEACASCLVCQLWTVSSQPACLRVAMSLNPQIAKHRSSSARKDRR